MAMTIAVILKVIHNFWYLIIALTAGLIYAQVLNDKTFGKR